MSGFPNYLPAHVSPTTPKKMMLAAPPTAQMKKNLNSALVMKDCTYFIIAYALIKAKTPGQRKETKVTYVHVYFLQNR